MASGYRCVMADHDDNAVDSTGTIHHPIYLEIMKEMRPNYTPLDLEGFIDMNRRTGIRRHYIEDLDFSEEEWQQAYNMWKEHPLREVDPPFFGGYLDVMSRFKSEEGIYVVVSHSDEGPIRRHYANASPEVSLDMVFASNGVPEHEKPFPWPIDMVMQEYGVSAEDIVVIDDLDPGIDMARKRGVDTIGTGWSHANPDSFREKCMYYAENVNDLEDMLF
ncbi:MAG: HAD family hydrolase [Candidatus Woesearchaeota archaeon]